VNWALDPAARPTGDYRVGPALCPYGHRLGPGQVLRGWDPCQCPPAMGNHRGHHTVRCETCAAHQITSVCYFPPHTWDTTK
jgi:hypothetical protein